MAEELENATLRIRRTSFVEETSRAIDEAQLIVLVGHAMGRRYQLTDSFEIGRGPGSPLEILDDGVSRQHAVVRHQPDGSYRIYDLGSRNGTFVNGERVSDALLNYGDKIAVGSRTVLLFANRDRFEDQRIQAQRLQALGQLAGGIAHDFNNLLGVVLANITHLQSLEPLDEDVARRTLAEVETAARRAVDLTRQLLAFARSGQRRHQPAAIDEIINDAKGLLARTLQSSTKLQTDAEPGLVVVGDASQLLQVLMNMCINADDAMPHGGTLEISAHRRVIESVDSKVQDMLPIGEFVSLKVCDEGEGMEPEVCARIFEPFFTTKPRGKGTGLGLATAYAIVRDHGGQINVDTKPGLGTTFEVLLPASSQLDPIMTRARRLTERQEVPVKATILLADDEELVRTATRRVLEHAGLEVILACDGQEAIEVFSDQNERIDLVILDLDMPRLDGEKAFTRLKQDYPDLRVLISSGFIDHDREANLRRAGVSDILHKPYDSVTLMQAIAKAMRLQSTRVEED